MNKIRGSIIAKVIAWFLFLAGVQNSVLFGICTVLGMGYGYYGMDAGEAWRDAASNVNAQYSLEVYDQMENNNIPQSMAENHFRYGIISGDSIKGNFSDLDFNSEKTYVATNFFIEDDSRNISMDQLYVYGFTDFDDYGSQSSWYGSLPEFRDVINREAAKQESTLNAEESVKWYGHYADRICYDNDRGVIYYRADLKYYPVQNVTLIYENEQHRYEYNYSFDFDEKAYRFNYRRPVDGEPDETDDIQSMDAVEKILYGDGFGSMFTFDELDATVFNHTAWGEILLDNIRSIDSSELTLISSSNLSPASFVNEEGYYLDENYTLMVMENIDAKKYWIVSMIPDRNTKGLDMTRYGQANWIINEVYRYGTNAIIFMIIALCITFGSLIFLVVGAGHRRNKEEIVTTVFDRMPFEAWTAIAAIGEGIVLMIVAPSIEYLSKQNFGILMNVLLTCVVIGGGIALWYFLGFCVRVKCGKWWRNSICYRVFNRIRGGFRIVLQNINIFWKMFLIIGVLSIFEYMGLVNARSDLDHVIGFWLLEKVIICFVLIKLLLQLRDLQEGSRHLAEGDLQYHIYTDKMWWECRKHAENLNKIGEGMSRAVDERMKSERFKTELITNVSHDIKTPLTSIINYVDLLGKEELHNDKAAEYLEVLDRQSSKLKKLIEDLVEASKASTGSLPVSSERIEAGVFLTQTVGEFEEKLSLVGLELIVNKPLEPVYIMADGRHLWRVVDNLMNNICKYAQPDSRVYVNLDSTGECVTITFRNMSKYPLNISGEELMERFVRGDQSRNTEGHGLGLSIAKSLMDLMKGELEIIVDGDLFKVVLRFAYLKETEREEI